MPPATMETTHRDVMSALLRPTLAALLVLLLVGCGATTGLNGYQSPNGRYAFLYPSGWTEVKVPGGPERVFHDLINSDETLSLVTSAVDPDRSLTSLGSPAEVGELLRRRAIAPEGSGRTAELVDARQRQSDGRTFYDFDYHVRLAGHDRHELATVVVDRGQLYTFAVGTDQRRWDRIHTLLSKVVTSFTLLT